MIKIEEVDFMLISTGLFTKRFIDFVDLRKEFPFQNDLECTAVCDTHSKYYLHSIEVLLRFGE